MYHMLIVEILQGRGAYTALSITLTRPRAMCMGDGQKLAQAQPV